MSNWQGVIQGYKEHNEMLMKMVKERGDENTRLREGIRKAIEQTSCDDTWEFLNRLLEGNENSDLPYRIGGRNDQP